MSKDLMGIERDVVLNTLIHDKGPIMISPVVKKGVSVEYMILQSDEYRIYPQGILFFKRFLQQWNVIELLLKSGTKANVRMNVTFYHRGRGLYFISTLNRVQKGYALMIPQQVQKMNVAENENIDTVNATIYLDGYSGVYAKCKESKSFPLFENKLWLYFSAKDLLAAIPYLKAVAGVEQTTLDENCTALLEDTKLLLYIPEKKIPKRNFFSFPVTITNNTIDPRLVSEIKDEVTKCRFDAYIPLCESPNKGVHAILGMKSRKVLLTPSDVLETLLLLPVCKFFAQDLKKGIPFVPNKITLTILCITETTIVLGANSRKKNIFSHKDLDEKHFPLEQGQEYLIQLRIPVESMLRIVSVRTLVSQVYNTDEHAFCAIGKFINLQEEDRRFLTEKFTNSKVR